jgi:hypothetical protein
MQTWEKCHEQRTGEAGMSRTKRYKAQAMPSPDPVVRVMPLVVEFIDSDLMPLIRRVILKRAELYLREIDSIREEQA